MLKNKDKKRGTGQQKKTFMEPTLDAMNPNLVKYLKTQYDISLYCIVYTILRFNLGAVEPLDDALLSTGFVYQRNHIHPPPLAIQLRMILV